MTTPAARNANRKDIKHIDDILRACDGHDRWDIIALQEFLPASETGDEVTMAQGHTALISRRRDGCFSTAIAIHRRVAGLP